VTKLDVQETAKTAIKRDNCGQTRFADQRRVSALADRKVERQRQFFTGQAVGGVRFPRAAKPEKRFLSVEELHRLAAAAAQYPIPEVGEQYRALVLVLGFCSLRWGEVAARVKRVDLLRRRLTVAESVTEVSGHLVWGTPKSHAARSAYPSVGSRFVT
jgi:integrase